jgi:phage replication-related protein YjqB (UPF0714/DUF867 family)
MGHEISGMSSYASFKDLAAHEARGSDYRIRFTHGRSGIAVMAIHGGGIERGTTEIAEALAGRRHSFYTFSGVKPAGNFRLHIASHRFDEPKAVEIARHSRAVVTIHGCRDLKDAVFIGGRHPELKARIKSALTQAGFPASESRRFQGVHPANLCNRAASGMGVQLEISRSLRRSLFTDISRLRRKTPTPLFHQFVTALGTGLG